MFWENFTNRNWITRDFLRETGRSPTGPGRGLSCTSGSTGSDRLRKAMGKPWSWTHQQMVIVMVIEYLTWLSWLSWLDHEKHQPFNMGISMLIKQPKKTPWIINLENPWVFLIQWCYHWMDGNNTVSKLQMGETHDCQDIRSIYVVSHSWICLQHQQNHTRWGWFNHLPSGKLSHNYGKSPCYSWENSLFLWPFSIANC